MHAFLYIAQEKGDFQKKIDSLDGKKIFFPFSKIVDVRDLNEFTKLKLTEKTVIVLENFDKSTTETQNAFLKALEEPQENLIYVLTANSLSNILPTIQSRSEIVYLSKTKKEFDKKKAEEFMNASAAEKLKLTSTIAKREQAIEFMENVIWGAHEELKEKPELFAFLENANKTLQGLEKNGNVQLQLTNFVTMIN